LKMEPIGCPETSVINYHYSLRNDPEERSSHLLRDGSLKSRKEKVTVSFTKRRHHIYIEVQKAHNRNYSILIETHSSTEVLNIFCRLVDGSCASVLGWRVKLNFST
jgi:hypothetical protein